MAPIPLPVTNRKPVLICRSLQPLMGPCFQSETTVAKLYYPKVSKRSKLGGGWNRIGLIIVNHKWKTQGSGIGISIGWCPHRYASLNPYPLILALPHGQCLRILGI